MSNYRRVSNTGAETHFSEALFGEAESSRMNVAPRHFTTFNAGDIVPVMYMEVLPHSRFGLNIDGIVRQTTAKLPTMGEMMVDYYAFWVPNRVVNQSFKAVMGEAYNKAWTANKVTLAPLVDAKDTTVPTQVQIPIGSVADYYGFATQGKIPKARLQNMNDLKFRGYVMIYNEFFRDENYQPPIPMSTLNVYQGFFSDVNRESVYSGIGVDGSAASNTPPASYVLDTSAPSDGSYPDGAIKHELYGSANAAGSPPYKLGVPARSAINSFSALGKPLKANKLHDYFTTVLPQPQKAPEQVLIPVDGVLKDMPVLTAPTSVVEGAQAAMVFKQASNGSLPVSSRRLVTTGGNGFIAAEASNPTGVDTINYYPSNLYTPGAPVSGLNIDIGNLRMAAAIQQVYEALGRGGSRYREYIKSFFGIDVDDPFDDIPKKLGHVRRSLDLYQTAQTSASAETPQGNLAAFGYTNTSGKLFDDIGFLEHGYIHVFAVVRHKNLYSSYMAKDNFRMSLLDFYQPQLCNVSEQPVLSAEINPFIPLNADGSEQSFGFQEYGAEYRYEPDRVSGLMRPGVPESLATWNYADEYDPNLKIRDAEWTKSNSEEVLNRTITETSEVAPQFYAALQFFIDKTLPMPTYGVPGMDVI